MKATRRVILRSLAATPLRLAVAYAGVIAISSIDWKPLPEWSADVLGYIVQFAASYFLALWILHGRSTRWSDGLIVAFTFIVVGTLLELLIAVSLRGPSPNILENAITWQGMALYVVYLLGVMFAAWQVCIKANRVV